MNKTRVLVVEDEVHICKLISDFMTAHDYEVTTVNDGPEALEAVQERGLPHIALIDLALPTMHGFELSSRLKAMADVPIIFVTSTSDTDTIVQGLRRYAEDFIVKPFQLRELEARVQAVLARMPSLDYASEPVMKIDEHLSVDFAHNRLTINNKHYTL
ncbi:MAG TPA: response regulator transcription factor, partial [Aggregatilineales bacterium]|nr:response regulator transcription factor [Aggregatilineales bacterium]